METIIIDPNHAHDKQAFYLKQLFVGYKDKMSIFAKDKLYQLPNEENVRVAITDTVVARQRDSNKEELRYEVVDESNLFGEGGYSQIYKIKCTLAIDGDTVIAKRKKARLVKVQKHDNGELPDLFKENELTRRAGDLHMKFPVIQKLANNLHVSYSVMRRISGKELFDFINDICDGRVHITTEDRINISINLLIILADLHAKKIIHRDIKPENIIINPKTLDVTFIDYGLSKNVETFDIGERVGTPGYSPIESFSGGGTNEKSDVFSLAIVIGLLWSAEPPDATITGTLDYQFSKIFSEGNIDLDRSEKTQMVAILKKMTNNFRDERCSVTVALKAFKEILKSYQQRKAFDIVTDRAYKILSDRGFMEKKPNKESTVKKDFAEIKSPRNTT